VLGERAGYAFWTWIRNAESGNMQTEEDKKMMIAVI